MTLLQITERQQSRVGIAVADRTRQRGFSAVNLLGEFLGRLSSSSVDLNYAVGCGPS